MTLRRKAASADRPHTRGRILLYALNHAPELIGIGKYVGEMTRWLAAAGYEVRVVTAPPYYPAWRVAEGFTARTYKREQRDGAEVIRCPIWVPDRPSGAKRILHLLSFALTSLPAALWQALTWRPDVVFAVAPAFFAAPGAWLASRLAGGTGWLHVQDFELDVATELGMVRGERLGRLVAAVERFTFRRFDRVSSISNRMCERLLAKGVSRDRVVFLPNWVDADAIRPLPHASPLRRALGLESDSVVALYAGNMGEKQGLSTLADAAQRLQHRTDIHFVFAGEGAGRAALEQRASALCNVTFLPLPPAEKLNDLLNVADLHLLPQRAGAADLVMPSKLTGMLASGRPVIAGAASETQIGACLQSCGVIVPPEDDAAMADAIAALASAPERRAALGRAAREYAMRTWGMDAVLGRLAGELDRVYGHGARGSAAPDELSGKTITGM
jgi:colanic acid biosynthesis glycosyl transferase WcaI